MIKSEYIDRINLLYNTKLGKDFPDINEIVKNNALNWLDEFALSNRSYYIFPSYSGGILIEYTTSALNVSVECHNNGEIEIISSALD